MEAFGECLPASFESNDSFDPMPSVEAMIRTFEDRLELDAFGER